MKLVTRLIAVAVSFLLVTPAYAAVAEDDQWAQPNAAQVGHHEILIEENSKSTSMASMLIGQKGEEQFMCKSLNDSSCSDAEYVDATQILGVCNETNTMDCIDSISAIDSSGKVFPAKFKEYIYYNHPNMFTGDGVKTVKYPLGPSTWTIDGASHGFGNEYTIGVGTRFKVDKVIDYDNLYLKMYPTSYGPTTSEALDANQAANFFSCKNTVKNGMRAIGCSESGPSGTHKCAFEMQKDGRCLLQHSYPEGFRFKVTLRLSAEPKGFFHGRLDTPDVQVAKLSGKSVNVSVTAGAVRVPIFFYQSEWSNTDIAIKNWWDSCLPSRQCNSGTRRPGLDNALEKDGAKRNVLYTPSPFEDQSFKAMDFFRTYASDAAAANPSAWNFRTLSTQEMSGSNSCFSLGAGLKGFVTTNSTVYSAGPPKLVNGQLTYRVAGMHYASDGKTLNEGTYDLLLRSDVARCIYKFTSAPIQASISVISSDGEAKTATTTVMESKGWLKLSARGYTYSSPTIKVRLSQSSAKKSTITCTKGKLTKSISGISPKCPAGFTKK